MIIIVTVLGHHDGPAVWDEVIGMKDALQSAVGEGGRLLYLTKRQDYNEASILIHIKEADPIADIITQQLSKIKDISRIWAIPLFRPRFFPLPKDTHLMKRFVVTAKIAPEHLSAVYKALANPNLPDGIKRVYYAYTFQLYDNIFQVSLLADTPEIISKYVAGKIDTLPGVLKTNIYRIEKTKPFITYQDWQAYAGKLPHRRWTDMLTHIEGWDV